MFQALIGDKLILYLLTSEKSGKSKLEESNESFIYLIVVQIIALLIDLLVYIVMVALPDDWCMTNSNMANVCMATVIVVIMFYLNVEAICGMVSFIFNVYQLFNAHAMARIIDIIEKEKEKK